MGNLRWFYKLPYLPFGSLYAFYLDHGCNSNLALVLSVYPAIWKRTCGIHAIQQPPLLASYDYCLPFCFLRLFIQVPAISGSQQSRSVCHSPLRNSLPRWCILWKTSHRCPSQSFQGNCIRHCILSNWKYNRNRANGGFCNQSRLWGKFCPGQWSACTLRDWQLPGIQYGTFKCHDPWSWIHRSLFWLPGIPAGLEPYGNHAGKTGNQLKVFMSGKSDPGSHDHECGDCWWSVLFHHRYYAPRYHDSHPIWACWGKKRSRAW